MHERTAKVVEQKEEIESQAEMLKESNEELLSTQETIQSQNEELQDQKEELLVSNEKLSVFNNLLKSKNEQITESIDYAKNIQRALLPSEELFSKLFDEHFIFYRPKDVISGDFYWCGQVGNYIIWTAVDCTGHGVPGALMSMLGVSMLNQVVLERKCTDSAEILFSLRKLLVEMFKHQQREESKDGMDMALCVLDRTNLKLHFSGAYNPMYLFRNKELMQFKADKMAIDNVSDSTKSFNKEAIQLEKGDHIYLFTDGFADQKGGPKGKKFFYPPFRDLLLANHQKPFSHQLSELERTIEQWMGDIEQYDDMLVLGVKI